MFTCREIVKSLIIECPTEALGTFEFRADISKQSDDCFFVQLYEKKMYRLHPFDGLEGGQADEMMWVDTSHIFTDESPCSSVEACEQKVFNTLRRFFGPPDLCQ